MKIKVKDTIYIKESLICIVLIIAMIIEVPYLFLISPIIMLLYIIVFHRNIKFIINKEFILLTIFIVFYFVIDTVLQQSTAYKVWYSLSVMCIYLYGLNSSLLFNNIRLNSRKLENLVKLLSLTFFIYVFVTIINSIRIGQFSISRNPIDIWKGTYRAATHYGTMLVFPIVYGIYLILIKNKFRQQIFGIFILVFAIFTCIETASRTILYLIPCGIVIVYFSKIKLDKKLKDKHIMQFVVILFILVIGIVAFKLNVFNIQNIVLSSQLGSRYSSGQATNIEDDARLSNTLFLLNHLKESFMGGGFTRLYAGNTHNMWLSVYDLGGVIPFSALSLYTLSSVKHLKIFLKQSLVSNDIKVLVITVYFISFLQMLFEPVLESVPVFVWSIIYVTGVIHRFAYYKGEISEVNV